GVHDHHDPIQFPVVQVSLDLIHHAHVNSVARPHPATNGDAITGNCETQHSLSQIRPAVLAVTPLPQARLTGSGSVLGISLHNLIRVFAFDLEVRAGRINEDQIHLKV